MSDIKVYPDEALINASEKYGYVGNTSYGYSFCPFNINKWTKYTVENNLKTTSFGKHYLGKTKKTYTPDEISFALTEAMRDMLRHNAFSSRETNRYYYNTRMEQKDDGLNMIDYVDPNNYEVVYIDEGHARNMKSAHLYLRNIKEDKNVALLYIQAFDNDTSGQINRFRNSSILSTRMGSQNYGGYGGNHLLYELFNAALGINCMMPIRRIGSNA